MVKSVAVLFARADSFYKTLKNCDVYDIERDARTYKGLLPVVAHPPCRAWGRLRHMAKPRADEKDLALFAVDMVRKVGGVLEHPEFSTLWGAAGLPYPGRYDDFGGWTLPIQQNWFGHLARKNTWLYICGVLPSKLNSYPFVLGEASHLIGGYKGAKKPEVPRYMREYTPPDMAVWLVGVAGKAARNG